MSPLMNPALFTLIPPPLPLLQSLISLNLPDVSFPLPSTLLPPPSAPSIVPPPPPEPSQSHFRTPPVEIPLIPLVSSLLSPSPTHVMVPPREIT